jgi:hypothetical protein
VTIPHLAVEPGENKTNHHLKLGYFSIALNHINQCINNIIALDNKIKTAMTTVMYVSLILRVYGGGRGAAARRKLFLRSQITLKFFHRWPRLRFRVYEFVYIYIYILL